MGLIRSLRRFYREWKVIFYVLGFLLFIQVFITFTSSPSLLEEEQIKRIRQIQMIRKKQAANALLQGEKPHYDDLEALNPKNPKFREEFLKHAGNADSIIEDENLKDHYEKIRVPRQPKKENADVFGVRPYDDVKYQPICEVTHKDAQSAITRAKSDKCKQEISDVACQLQEKMLFPESMPRTCPHDYKFVFHAPMPSSVDESLPKVRICYILVVHGRSFRQFKRLLRVIYHRDHYYYIHVDKRSDYLLRQVLKETKQYMNVKVASWRMATIWGGSSLLQMLLRALKDVLYLWNDWDFFINLSALDFPIENDKKLIDFLSTYRDKNFMKSHGREDEKFIRKQGLNRVFVECDQHMWRLGERDLPKGITVNGGSDWVALNRKFCQYVITGKDKLLSDLKHWYKYTLLPAESFFHTLAQNSDRCETFVDNNLRVTNWNRARGCKCQYKHIVDWCGCSPNDFYPSDLVRLKTTRPVFFARKFEEVINQEVVNHLDFKLYGEYPSGTPALNSYWENCYDHLDGLDSVSDAAITHYTSFGRLGLSQLARQLKYSDNEGQCSLHLDKIYEVDVFKTSETFAGYVLTIGASWSPKTKDEEPDGKFQVHVFQFPTLKITDAGSKLAKRLSSAMVGTNWDVKELALRDWGGLVGPNSDPHLVARWRKGDEDFVVTVAVIDPLNVVADYNDFRTPSKAAGVTETPLSLRKPMRPGRWTIKFYIQRQFTQVCAEVEFFVTPVQYVKGVEGDKQLRTDNRGVEDDAELNSANRNLYSIRTTLGLQKDSEALQSLMSNSLHIAGDRLKSWIDAVLGRLWKVKEVCFVAASSAQWSSAQPSRCSEQRQVTPPLCQNQNWSSFSPDPKSELGKVKRNGRIR